jgi:hypothetical protein
MVEKEVHLTDSGGKPITYVIISKKWKHMVTALLYCNLVFLFALMIAVYKNIVRLDDGEKSTAIMRERNRAMDEMLVNRAKSQEWVFKETCDRAKKEGRMCFENPQWWADPAKYPHLVNDPDGTGLFPKK